jgi:hypothetical protein
MTSLPPLPGIVPPVPIPTIGTDRPGPAAIFVPPTPRDLPSVIDTPLPADPVNMTTVANEASEALLGIPAELASGRGSVYDIVTRGNRLRGLGIILVCIALCAAILGLMR